MQWLCQFVRDASYPLVGKARSVSRRRAAALTACRFAKRGRTCTVQCGTVFVRMRCARGALPCRLEARFVRIRPCRYATARWRASAQAARRPSRATGCAGFVAVCSRMHALRSHSGKAHWRRTASRHWRTYCVLMDMRTATTSCALPTPFILPSASHEAARDGQPGQRRPPVERDGRTPFSSACAPTWGAFDRSERTSR